MGRAKFFQEEKKLSPNAKMTMAYECVKKLVNTLKSKGIIRPAKEVKILVWLADFENLATEFPEGKIQLVLNWFCDNVSKIKGIPKIASAKAFRQHFRAIENAMVVSNPKAAVEAYPAEVKSVIRRLQQLVWPKGSSSSLPTAVSTSYESFEQFREQARNLYQKNILSNEKNIRLLRVLLDRHIIDASWYIYNWFWKAWNRLASWKEWNGNLSSEVWSLESSRFNREMMDIAERYCGEANRWNTLRKMIEENKNE